MTDHEAALRATQAALEAGRPVWQALIDGRREAVLEAVKGGMSVYRIGKILGLNKNAVKQILKTKESVK